MFNHTLEGGEGGGRGSRGGGGRGVQGGVPPLLLRCTAVLIHAWAPVVTQSGDNEAEPDPTYAHTVTEKAPSTPRLPPLPERTTVKAAKMTDTKPPVVLTRGIVCTHNEKTQAARQCITEAPSMEVHQSHTLK